LEFSLKAACRAIVPEKTTWWLVSFKWEGHLWEYTSIQDSPGEVCINDIHNVRKVLRRLEVHQAYETLGVFLAPDGNLTDQFNKMKSTAIQWSDGLHTGNIKRDEVWLALQSTTLLTLAYPLPALHLTKAQCEAIPSPILQYCLPAFGICRNFPRKLVFATPGYMGLNIRHLFMIQEIARIKDIIFHTFNDTLTGKLYKTNLKLFLIELGLRHNYKHPDTSTIDLLTTESLTKSTELFITQYNITLKHNIEI
jgi:hypothetical protein